MYVATGGSEAPVHPERKVAGTDRKWQDFAANRKAASWWALRLRFEQSYKAANGLPYDPDEIISINPNIKDLSTPDCAVEPSDGHAERRW